MPALCVEVLKIAFAIWFFKRDILQLLINNQH